MEDEYSLITFRNADIINKAAPVLFAELNFLNIFKLFDEVGNIKVPVFFFGNLLFKPLSFTFFQLVLLDGYFILFVSGITCPTAGSKQCSQLLVRATRE